MRFMARAISLLDFLRVVFMERNSIQEKLAIQLEMLVILAMTQVFLVLTLLGLCQFIKNSKTYG